VSGSSTTPVEARASASVIVLRSGKQGPELLYLLRNPALKFHGDYWVFPGGRIDDADYSTGTPNERDEEHAAACAAAREAREEAGIEVRPSQLVFAIHWTTPTANPIRFATWFFVAETQADTVEVDGEEIHDFRWLTPSDALRRHARGAIKLAAPTFALTTRFAAFPSVSAALSAVAEWPRERLMGRVYDVEGGRVVTYAQDRAYETGELDEAGSRHRLWMVAGGWRYERSF